MQNIASQQSQKSTVWCVPAISTLATTLILLGLMLVMLILRIVPNYHLIFTDWPNAYGSYVNFASDDAVYHMRVVHNTIQHFPYRIFFDPFTNYPFGSQIHFGPWFTLLIAGVAMLVGFGHPGPMLVNSVGAYLPPILGALCLIPTYFIGKKIFSRNVGILAAAILAFLPGEFFQRSTLGFTDHHVVEVLYSTATLAFLVYAFFAWREQNLKKIIGYSLGAGLLFGIYLLSWPAAVLFGAILAIAFVAEIILEYMHGEKRGYLMLIAGISFLIPALMALPYAIQNPRLQFYYSLTQPLTLLILLLIIGLVYGLAKLFNNCRRKWPYLITLIGLLVLIILVIQLLPKHAYSVLISGINLLVSPNPGMRTVTEMWPILIDRDTGLMTFRMIWHNFYWAFPLAFLAMCTILPDRIRRRDNPSYVLLFVWSVVIFYSMLNECRFAYYFAINAALLASYCWIEIVAYAKALIAKTRLANNIWQQFLFGSLVVALSILGVIYPQSVLVLDGTPGWYGPHISREWYDTYVWLKEHTPDPQGKIIQKNFDYRNGFYSIPKNPDAKYPYPASAYGIAAWWNIGHQITYIAERIPNCNPFQQGIVVNGQKQYGMAPFFTADDENTAFANLNWLNARYVLIDNSTASTQYPAMLLWEGDKRAWHEDFKTFTVATKQGARKVTLPIDSQAFHTSMLNRLYYFDGDHLQHFRLIYESSGNYILNTKSFNTRTGATNRHYKITNSNFGRMLELYNNARQLSWLDAKQELLLYDAMPPSKQIKIFEKVNGATIAGTVQDGVVVHLSLTLVTNTGRLLLYTQETIAKNGQYSFTVPYPTAPIVGAGYHYEVMPITPYKITIGNQVKYVQITEAEVISGNIGQ